MDTGEIDTLHHLHHLLWECYTGMIPLADAAFEDSELTLPLGGTLDLIGHQPGVTVSELARTQPKSQQAVSQLVAKLERLGLIERRLGRGRGVGLHLTEAGRAARDEAIERESRLERRLCEALGTEVYEDARVALERIRTAFRQHSDPSPDPGAS